MKKKEEKEKKIFDYVMVVTKEKAKIEITYRYPPISTEKKDPMAQNIMQFCFPEGERKEIVQKETVETFSFVLTEQTGEKRYGYCRRFFGQKSDCFCLVSFYPSFELFAKILDIVEEKRKLNKSAVFSFLQAILAKPFPEPGETIEVRTFGNSKQGQDVYELTYPLVEKISLNYVDYQLLMDTLSVPTIIEMFKSILIERRIIIVSNSLSKLSSCISSINSLTFPFTWHHIYIPVLPLTLIDYCTAPMPFLVGLLKVHLPNLEKMPLEEVVVLDLDTDSFLAKPAKFSIPTNLEKQLKRCLKSLKKLGSSYFTDPQSQFYSLPCSEFISDSSKPFELVFSSLFQHFFFTVFDGYDRFFNSKSRFEPNQFAETKEQQTKKFIEEFSMCQMFEVFMREQETKTLKYSFENKSELVSCLTNNLPKKEKEKKEKKEKKSLKEIFTRKSKRVSQSENLPRGSERISPSNKSNEKNVLSRNSQYVSGSKSTIDLRVSVSNGDHIEEKKKGSFIKKAFGKMFNHKKHHSVNVTVEEVDTPLESNEINIISQNEQPNQQTSNKLSKPRTVNGNSSSPLINRNGSNTNVGKINSPFLEQNNNNNNSNNQNNNHSSTLSRNTETPKKITINSEPTEHGIYEGSPSNLNKSGNSKVLSVHEQWLENKKKKELNNTN